MLRFAPRLMVALLCASALAACATTTTPDAAKMSGGQTAAEHAKKEAAADVDKTMPTDLEGGIRQAQLMRYAGRYDDAIHVLSQLMLVASDDPRVVAEYGKTLAEKGRAQDAVEFLNRAIELSSNDWTLYSALGVSYDQLGNQTSARTAYEHALALRPEEPSVLNNYALSRMLANDPDGAHLLIARAQAAGGSSDSKIAANIAMMNQYAPPAPQPLPQVAVAKAEPAPKPAPVQVAKAAPRTTTSVARNTPRTIVPAATQAAPANAPVGDAETVAQNIINPPPVADAEAVARNTVNPPPVYSMPAPNNGVVMQAVPFDPLAGPVKLHPPVAKAAANVKPASAKTASAVEEPALPPLSNIKLPPGVKLPASAKTAPADANKPAKPIKAASNEAPPLRLTADARNP